MFPKERYTHNWLDTNDLTGIESGCSNQMVPLFNWNQRNLWIWKKYTNWIVFYHFIPAKKKHRFPNTLSPLRKKIKMIHWIYQNNRHTALLRHHICQFHIQLNMKQPNNCKWHHIHQLVHRFSINLVIFVVLNNNLMRPTSHQSHHIDHVRTAALVAAGRVSIYWMSNFKMSNARR